jgi:hypothetical protein
MDGRCSSNATFRRPRCKHGLLVCWTSSTMNGSPVRTEWASSDRKQVVRMQSLGPGHIPFAQHQSAQTSVSRPPGRRVLMVPMMARARRRSGDRDVGMQVPAS